MHLLLLTAMLTVGTTQAARGAHDSRLPAREVVVNFGGAPSIAAVVVWHEEEMRYVDDVAAVPAPSDPEAHIPGTRIRLRSGFTPGAVSAAEHF